MIRRLALVLILCASPAAATEARDLARAAAECAGYNDAGQAVETARGSYDRHQAELAEAYFRAALLLWPDGKATLGPLRAASAEHFLPETARADGAMAQTCQNLGLRLRELTGEGFH